MALSAAGAPRESGGGAFTLVVENDLFSANGQDRNYTSGLKAAYLTPAGAEPRWARRLGDILPGYADRLDTRFEFEIGQSTIIFICIAIVNCSSIDIGSSGGGDVLRPGVCGMWQLREAVQHVREAV
jgi:hypothetical protein